MIKRVKPMYVIPQLLLSQKEKYSFSTTFKFYLGELMKKRIANGLELLLLLVSFIILWLPTLKVQHVDLIRDLPLDAYALGLVPRGNVYIIFFFYAITALMCIISIFVKSEHRDGKMHVIMPILLFLWTAPMLHVQVGTVVDEWEIVESTFPIYLFLGCLLSVFTVILPIISNRKCFLRMVSMMSHNCFVERARRETSSVMIVSPCFACSKREDNWHFTAVSPCSYSRKIFSAPARFSSRTWRATSCLFSFVEHLAYPYFISFLSLLYEP